MMIDARHRWLFEDVVYTWAQDGRPDNLASVWLSSGPHELVLKQTSRQWGDQCMQGCHCACCLEKLVIHERLVDATGCGRVAPFKLRQILKWCATSYPCRLIFEEEQLILSTSLTFTHVTYLKHAGEYIW
jgi:hypothetical protein